MGASGSVASIPIPDHFGSYHIGVTCDGCGLSPMIGPRFKCRSCDSYNLCQSCISDRGVHHPQHVDFETVQSGLASNAGGGHPQLLDRRRAPLAIRGGGSSHPPTSGSVVSVIELQLLLSHMEQQMVSILFEQQQRSLQAALQASMEGQDSKPKDRPASRKAVESLDLRKLGVGDKALDESEDGNACPICLEVSE